MEYFSNPKLIFQVNKVFIDKLKISFLLSKANFWFGLFSRDFINHSIFLFFRFIFTNKKPAQSNSILLINSEKMGDIFLAVDFIHSLTQSNKYEKIFLVLQSHLVDIIDELKLKCTVLPYNKNRYRFNIFYRYSFLSRLNKLGCKTIFNISPERGSLNDELTIVPLSVEKYALKPDSIYLSGYFNKKKKIYYTKFFGEGSDNIYNLYQKSLTYLKINLKEWDSDFVSSDNNNFVVIAPSSSEEFRNWDKEKFKEVVSFISKKQKVYLIGTKEQSKLLQYIADDFSNVEVKLNLELIEIIRIIQRSKLFIGLDSGLSHLALLLKTNLIAIIGGGKHGQFFPYKQSEKNRFLFYEMNCFNCYWFCKYKLPYCLENVSVDDVIKSYLELVEKHQ